MVARYRPDHPSRGAKRSRYSGFKFRGPEQRLADQLASIARHRRHVAQELERLERLLDQHPRLRRLVSPEEARPRLVVDNASSDDWRDQTRIRNG